MIQNWLIDWICVISIVAGCNRLTSSGFGFEVLIMTSYLIGSGAGVVSRFKCDLQL